MYIVGLALTNRLELSTLNNPAHREGRDDGSCHPEREADEDVRQHIQSPALFKCKTRAHSRMPPLRHSPHARPLHATLLSPHRERPPSSLCVQLSLRLAFDLLRQPVAPMQKHEPERPGMTPITLVTGRTTTYCLWIEQS